MSELTPDQINQLLQLGIQVNQKDTPPILTPIALPATNSNKKINPVFPLLSISGLTILSFSGLILFKNKAASTPITKTDYQNPSSEVTPTQVPKSIQHYLLTSQQYFTQATQNQSVDALNQSILAATQAIKEFPTDYRGFYQRGRIYQSILSSKPDLISQVLADLSEAAKLEPTNSDITRSLAAAYAQKGDAQNTISYLNLTVSLDPTKAQNFYDLAKIQQQVGLFSQALDTYNRLLTLISDPAEKTQVETDKTSLEKIIAQNPNPSSALSDQTVPTISTSPLNLDSPTIQASAGNGLIVAAPESLDKINVSNLTSSNSLSGSSTLPANQKDMTLTNSQLSTTSQVYLTVTKGGKNQKLQVISKSDKSFTVGLDTPISEDVQFNWWIVN
jgi:tetratricopeptide (TPR) repeat protein